MKKAGNPFLPTIRPPAKALSCSKIPHLCDASNPIVSHGIGGSKRRWQGDCARLNVIRWGGLAGILAGLMWFLGYAGFAKSLMPPWGAWPLVVGRAASLPFTGISVVLGVNPTPEYPSGRPLPSSLVVQAAPRHERRLAMRRDPSSAIITCERGTGASNMDRA